MRTVKSNTKPAVYITLIIHSLKDPHYRLHVVHTPSLVSILKIYPASYMLNIPFPLFRHSLHIFLAFNYKLINSNLFLDILFSFYSKFSFNLILDRKSMTIPSPHPSYTVAFHCPISAKNIFWNA